MAARAHPPAHALAFVALVALAAGCGGREAGSAAGNVTGGVAGGVAGTAAAGVGDGLGSRADVRRTALVVAATAEPSTLLPPFAADLVAGLVVDLVYQRLADPLPGFSTVGDRDYRPALARAWSWAPDSGSVHFALDPAARWHDGAPVTSRDVVFTLDVLRDTTLAGARAGLAGVVDSARVDGPHGVTVWVRRGVATTFHELTFATYVLPAHRLAGTARAALHEAALRRAPVGSGPFRFVTWTPGQAITLAAARDAAATRSGPRRVVVRFLPDYQAAIAALATGDADVVDYVRPADAPRVARLPHTRVLRLPGFGYAALQFNLRAPAAAAGASAARASVARASAAGAPPHPVLGDPTLRRALAMAIDRRALARNLLDTLGAVSLGPVTRAQATADTALRPPPYDPAGARRRLDALGWRVPPGRADGVRVRGGRALRLALLVPGSSAARVQAAVLVQHMLAQVGVAVDVERRDNAALVAELRGGRFDAALTAYRVDPAPGGVAEAWGGAAARTGRGFNFGRYASARVDALLDSARRAGDAAAQRALYRRAYQQILDDVPAVFLYEPAALVALPRRFEPRGVRADAWWADLAHWSLRGSEPTRADGR